MFSVTPVIVWWPIFFVLAGPYLAALFLESAGNRLPRRIRWQMGICLIPASLTLLLSLWGLVVGVAFDAWGQLLMIVGQVLVLRTLALRLKSLRTPRYAPAGHQPDIPRQN
jgi:hypothetical protein